jgi:hypothetical protein
MYALVKHMEHTSATFETCMYGMCLKHLLETYATYLVILCFNVCMVWCSCLVMQVGVDVTSFMCHTSLSIYSDHWKSFMKLGIKKSHEMISHIFVSVALLSVWIAPLSEWNYRP